MMIIFAMELNSMLSGVTVGWCPFNFLFQRIYCMIQESNQVENKINWDNLQDIKCKPKI